MKELTGTLPSDYIKEWKELEDSSLSRVFKVYNVPNGGNSASSGQPGFPDQWSRIMGIDYGTVSGDFYNIVKNNPNAVVIMHLAVADNNFLVVFEVQGTSSQFYVSDLSDHGRFYDINSTPERTLVPYYGISGELANQLSYNWLVWPHMVSDLFYALAHIEGETGRAQDKRGFLCPVRAHRYYIDGYNLAVLKLILTPETTIKLKFGVNIADLLIDEDMFTLVLEVDPSGTGTSDKTYLDFVGACPPTCPQS